MSHEYVLNASCPDREGILASISGFLADSACNIVDCQQFSDPESGTFFTRIHFACPDTVDVNVLKEKFTEVARELRMNWRVRGAGTQPRSIVLVSKELHCLNDLLFRQRIGTLPVEVRAIVSNHTHAAELAEWHGIPFHHLPIVDGDKAAQEDRVLALVDDEDIELVILARYMQILSPRLCALLSERIINIHHSFLPSFKGAKPYQQAHRAGVKLIGATAHYVTADLDEGPIIEQDVLRVDHRHDPAELLARGRDLECNVLARAVKWHSEHRVLRNGNRTVVFG
jgi:formyltetrahydrofolate deformylase